MNPGTLYDEKSGFVFYFDPAGCVRAQGTYNHKACSNKTSWRKLR